LWGASTIINEDKNEVKRYLLGQLGEADEERVELRLLTDPYFTEEFDTVVDEITDQYAGNEFQGEERKRVEQYFLRSTERQNKVMFAGELLRQAEVERGRQASDLPVQPVDPPEPGFFERARLFWAKQSFAFRGVTAFASLVIVVGVALLVIPDNRPSGTYALINLTLSNADRASGAETKSVKLELGSPGIKIELALPEQIPQAKSYRVELLDEQQVARDLRDVERKAQSLVVTVPANEIKRGSYIIRLYAVNPDGSEQRIRGSYFFNVE
jgi:methionine-rich copper-binding protein CopC